ncbi:major outer membrane protein [Campylobacter hyointestinalis]|uniref:Major outer membrane protein n=1 Tax=Campylobacter hyointestinalis TaxID=198 RepID=A0A562XM06_CAMHY|nr:major outer membrane protein [Campylobacter hyointestinalis]TWO23120.1 major outer membrane protein [Campylobacter hyointestinalis]
MKLVKMSLAAIVAAGALSSVASATPLEEAIKNVDVSGFARLRYQNTNTNIDKGQDSSNGQYRFTMDVNFKAALDDNFYGVLGFRYDSQDISGDANGRTNTYAGDNGFDNYGQTFNVRQMFLGYKVGNTTIQAGRQVLGTFFTDDMVGTGLKVLNTDITGLTLAAVAFDDLQADKDIGYSTKDPATGDYNGGTYNSNLYGVAAIGSYDPFSFQLWYANLQDVAQLYAVDAGVSFDVTSDINLGLQGQYGASSIDDRYKEAGITDADFWALQAKFKGFGVDARAGYVDFSADKKDGNIGKSLISYEDQGKFIEAGEDLFDIYKAFTGDNNYWFLVAGYTFDKFRVGVDYVDGKITKYPAIGEQDAYEVVARADYQYSKKLKFQTWFGHYEIDGKDTRGDEEADRFRFDVRYNF